MKPAGLPDPEHYPHGTRARYIGGHCRCTPCRAANTSYERDRDRARARGEHNGLVSAAPARLHLAALSRQGVGYKSAADAASVARSVVAKVVNGARSQIRARTSAALLAVDVGAAADGAVIDGAPTWKDVRWLLENGLTRGEISQRIGNQRAALQVRARVLATTAMRIAKLRREVEEELRLSEGMPEICAQCGYSHAPEDRQAIVRRMLPLETSDIQEALPCFYGTGKNDAGYQRLMRDLRAIRSEVVCSAS